MKMNFLLCKLATIVSLGLSNAAFGMGQQAEVFEARSPAGIWDHGHHFYLRLDLSEIDGHADQRFIWAGFHFHAANVFKGEIVINQFSSNEIRYSAQARLVHSTDAARYFLVEVLDSRGEIAKEFFLKGPAGPVIVDR